MGVFFLSKNSCFLSWYLKYLLILFFFTLESPLILLASSGYGFVLWNKVFCFLVILFGHYVDNNNNNNKKYPYYYIFFSKNVIGMRGRQKEFSLILRIPENICGNKNNEEIIFSLIWEIYFAHANNEKSKYLYISVYCDTRRLLFVLFRLFFNVNF